VKLKHVACTRIWPRGEDKHNLAVNSVTEDVATLTFKRRIKFHLPFAGIIKSSPYSPRFQDKG